MGTIDIKDWTIKQNAIQKMLKEMEEEHTGTDDIVHNWICEQDDITLFEGVMKKGRTIKDAIQYCATKASSQKTDNVAMIDDQTVFSWIREYFLLEKLPNNKGKAVVKANATKTKKVEKKVSKEKKGTEVNKGYEQLDLLDFLQ
ncbi:hypothetical protein A6C07_14475 [Listeria monocytogenes]|nr:MULTISPECIES: Cas9 inhibitor AcrIIA9 family protein [Listeria]EAA0242914.1 hypothetical protein [Listeria monocytogenes]EAC3779000.1 hypothetical protein [Listeria monocytogenes]EAC4520805.1 hypothetical protein [Listeria monocytogenes]EAC8688089.1 hypothetical protein [Listeria monocytogenes]EAD5546837.1 hypothetical protein [Listeria monocytogenes]